MSSFIELDYYCAHSRSLPTAALAWEHAPAAEIALPSFSLKAITPTIEQILKEKRGPAPPVAVFSVTKRNLSARRFFVKYGPAAIAASVIVFVSIWFGTRPQEPIKPNISADASSAAAAHERLNPLVRVKRAIEKRAVVEVTDTFKEGMKAWGAPAGWVPGWSRHPDGYVRPGHLALFQPTSTFTDYRLVFFGQVEDRGLGWAVRARDPRNYYAMKLQVLAGGLRPVLEMIHYPVVGGTPGPQVKVPLSVMIHANTPYHVAVKVAGNRLTASVEGQEVDSWTDDVEPSGAVGFFTEPGERARLYWMKVYKNDDWLGRICGFLAGNSVDEPGQTAWLNRPVSLWPYPDRLLPLFPVPALLARGREDSYEGIRPWNS
jgi:hypothetical protein